MLVCVAAESRDVGIARRGQMNNKSPFINELLVEKGF